MRIHLKLAASLCATIVCSTQSMARADVVTDWDETTVRATKGFDGAHGTTVTLDSNLASRIEAIEARAVFDAINAIEPFASSSYYYHEAGAGSVDVAAAQAAHDVLRAQLPDPRVDATVDAQWTRVHDWLDAQLAAALASAGDDPGVAVGKASAAAANAARKLDGASPVVAYGAQLSPTSNPGIGIWRQSNAGAPYVQPSTGAPTGFDATGATIQGKPGIDLNWRDVTPFTLTTQQKTKIVRDVPASPEVGSAEYVAEVDYVRRYGQDSSTVRSADQTAQALYYKQDIEIVLHEVARVASSARHLPLHRNAALFVLLSDALADARFAAFDSKYELKFWRPITAINASASGAVSNYAWHPLAATPSHPSNTAGHAATGAAGFEVLRAFFGSDNIQPDGSPAQLGTLPWLVGTNSGTGKTTTRALSTFSQGQLENGASRIYLGVHFGFDILQGHLLGLAVADAVLRAHTPAGPHLVRYDSRASLLFIARTLWSRPDLYGVFAKPTTVH